MTHAVVELLKSIKVKHHQREVNAFLAPFSPSDFLAERSIHRRTVADPGQVVEHGLSIQALKANGTVQRVYETSDQAIDGLLLLNIWKCRGEDFEPAQFVSPDMKQHAATAPGRLTEDMLLHGLSVDSPKRFQSHAPVRIVCLQPQTEGLDQHRHIQRSLQGDEKIEQVGPVGVMTNQSGWFKVAGC